MTLTTRTTCQSRNHTRADCHGALWTCTACSRIVCCAEGGADDTPELCDDCAVAITTALAYDSLVDLARAIALAHHKADSAALAGEALTAEAPVGYITGASSVEDDIRGEWIDEDDATIEAAVAHAYVVKALVERAYRAMVTQ
jgi:hypothetical protein